MILQLENQELHLTQNLPARNLEVNRAFTQITDEARNLLTQFDSTLYRTYYEINHTVTGGNILKEWVCHFWSISLFKSPSGKLLIYFSYDEDALDQFGNKLFSDILRVLFKHTMFDYTNLNIESCLKVDKSPKDIHSLFIKQLQQKSSEHITKFVEEILTA